MQRTGADSVSTRPAYEHENGMWNQLKIHIFNLI
jgi:hypothetical protein